MITLTRLQAGTANNIGIAPPTSRRWCEAPVYATKSEHAALPAGAISQLDEQQRPQRQRPLSAAARPGQFRQAGNPGSASGSERPLQQIAKLPDHSRRLSETNKPSVGSRPSSGLPSGCSSPLSRKQAATPSTAAPSCCTSPTPYDQESRGSPMLGSIRNVDSSELRDEKKVSKDASFNPKPQSPFAPEPTHLRRDDLLRDSLKKIVEQLPSSVGTRSGHDWRFLNPKEYCEVKDEAIKRGKGKIARKLLECALYGTQQATERGTYPLVDSTKVAPSSPCRAKTDVPMVELWKYMKEPSHLSWLRTLDSELPASLAYHPDPIGRKFHEPPMTCVGAHPLTVAEQVAQIMKDEPALADTTRVVVHMDAVFEDRVGEMSSSLRPKAVDDIQESFFIRTELSRFLEKMETQIKLGSDVNSGGFREHLHNAGNPYALLCRDVALFRGSSENGFQFLPEPVSLDGLMVTSLPTERPGLKRLPNNRKGHPRVEYSDGVDQKALVQILKLITHGCVNAFEDCNTILILTLPGCLDRRAHPFYSVVKCLRDLRFQKGRLFQALYLACGDEETATMADFVINEDLYEHSGYLKEKWRSPFCNDFIEELAALSVNPVWRGLEPDYDNTRESTLIGKLRADDLGNSGLGGMLKKHAHKAHQHVETNRRSMKQGEILGVKKSCLAGVKKPGETLEREQDLSADLERLASRFEDRRRTVEKLKKGQAWA